MGAINGVIVSAGVAVRRTVGRSAHLSVQDALFYLLLLTLVITMYDRYRVIGNRSQDQRPPLGRRLNLRWRFDRVQDASPEAAGGP